VCAVRIKPAQLAAAEIGAFGLKCSTEELRPPVRGVRVVDRPDGGPGNRACGGSRTKVPGCRGVSALPDFLALGCTHLMDVTDRSYPARLEGHLDPSLSRWKWLIKWLLVIPHVVLLVFLWIAAVLLTVIAGFVILFTGRYPRGIFDFNLGVMRWTWRVSFYAVSAFGTDRYPPFTLKERADYPAAFTVDYPDHLSRGLVLVKWWLLAIPHYLVVAIFAGGWAFGGTMGWRDTGGGGLISLLAVIAGIILLVRGRYPRDLFSLVMGLNRWCYRVLAYAMLMRDEYPPFRLDNGGTDPGSVRNPTPTAAPTPTTFASHRSADFPDRSTV
jgi:hypothetical protein